ncbi:hypothetical protein WICPIJ_006432 [Wickerhamomyces pijperi]|uniref:Uncharacterized protein n=1 Tax=Wickerhamomyces pijperi TaxID=599730 RepID=A0A9P8Q3T5_WICPI|nr:hypothetical protein WICPIJ_006432 [Wickerhamomyces pijperi]
MESLQIQILHDDIESLNKRLEARDVMNNLLLKEKQALECKLKEAELSALDHEKVVESLKLEYDERLKKASESESDLRETVHSLSGRLKELESKSLKCTEPLNVEILKLKLQLKENTAVSTERTTALESKVLELEGLIKEYQWREAQLFTPGNISHTTLTNLGTQLTVVPDFFKQLMVLGKQVNNQIETMSRIMNFDPHSATPVPSISQNTQELEQASELRNQGLETPKRASVTEEEDDDDEDLPAEITTPTFAVNEINLQDQGVSEMLPPNVGLLLLNELASDLKLAYASHDQLVFQASEPPLLSSNHDQQEDEDYTITSLPSSTRELVSALDATMPSSSPETEQSSNSDNPTNSTTVHEHFIQVEGPPPVLSSQADLICYKKPTTEAPFTLTSDSAKPSMNVTLKITPQLQEREQQEKHKANPMETSEVDTTLRVKRRRLRVISDDSAPSTREATPAPIPAATSQIRKAKTVTSKPKPPSNPHPPLPSLPPPLPPLPPTQQPQATSKKPLKKPRKPRTAAPPPTPHLSPIPHQIYHRYYVQLRMPKIKSTYPDWSTAMMSVWRFLCYEARVNIKPVALSTSGNTEEGKDEKEEDEQGEIKAFQCAVCEDATQVLKVLIKADGSAEIRDIHMTHRCDLKRLKLRLITEAQNSGGDEKLINEKVKLIETLWDRCTPLKYDDKDPNDEAAYELIIAGLYANNLIHFDYAMNMKHILPYFELLKQSIIKNKYHSTLPLATTGGIILCLMSLVMYFMRLDLDGDSASTTSSTTETEIDKDRKLKKEQWLRQMAGVDDYVKLKITVADMVRLGVVNGGFVGDLTKLINMKHI